MAWATIALRTDLEKIRDTFQTGTTAVFKAAAKLELEAVGKTLMECSIGFVDLLIKYKLLVGNDACREHKLSSELTIMVLLAEAVPPNLEMDDDEAEAFAYPGNDKDMYAVMKRLLFNCDPATAYAAIGLTRDLNTQPGPITEEEQMSILQVQVELKKTLVNCMVIYHNQFEEIKLANEAKEMILLTATTKSADDTGEVLDDDGDESNLLPDSMEELKRMMQEAIIDHENANNKSGDKPVKDKRGASKSSKKKKNGKETNGGGASANQNNQNTKNQAGKKSSGSKKKKKNTTRSPKSSSEKKRRAKADGAGSGSSTGKPKNKKQRSSKSS